MQQVSAESEVAVLQVSLETQSLAWVAREQMPSELGTCCFSPCSQRLLLPWSPYEDAFCLDIVPCPAGVPGKRVRLSDEAFREQESFACLADGVAVSQANGLLVYDWEGQRTRRVGWADADYAVQDDEGCPLLACCPQRHLLAVLRVSSGVLLVYNTQRWQLQDLMQCGTLHGDVCSFVLTTDAGSVLSSHVEPDALQSHLLVVSQSSVICELPVAAGSASKPVLSHDSRWLARCHAGCVCVHRAASGDLHFQHRLTRPGQTGAVHTFFAWTAELALLVGCCGHRESLTPDRLLLFQF